MQNLDYRQVVESIENKRRFGNLKGVEISAIMLEKLGHPEQGFPMIHIAGTNGKGSVSAFLRSVLEKAGYKTGMFTSPHLIDFRERIQVGGNMIPEEDVRRLGNRLLSMDFNVYPTMFDYCLAMALLYFREQNCDVIILETGLGGTYDSTNACGVPDVSVITKIGFDHMAILGDTLSQIAAEKAGIIKRGTSLVLESQEEEAMQPLRKRAEKEKIAGIKTVDWNSIRILPKEDGRPCFTYEEKEAVLAPCGRWEHLTMKMLGVHQYENAVAAILAAEAFWKRQKESGKQAPSAENMYQAIRDGIAETEWMGRMELVCTNPYFLLDGAHNSNGVDALKRSLENLYPGEKFHFIMGVMADKDYGKMIEELLPLALDFKTVTVESNRALQGEELAACIREMGIPATACNTISETLPDFSKKTEEKTVVFGSLYFIGEMEGLLKKITK